MTKKRKFTKTLKLDLFLWKKWNGKKNEVKGSIAYRGLKKPQRGRPLFFKGWDDFPIKIEELLRRWGWKMTKDNGRGWKLKWKREYETTRKTRARS